MDRQMEKGTALITGATSVIGAVYADRLARYGFDLVLVARNRGRLDALASRLEAQTLAMVEPISADLNDPADLHRIESFLHTDSDTQHRMIGLNVTALTRLCCASALAFSDRGEGTIVNFSSIEALAPELSNGIFGASKAYVLAFSQSLRLELRGTGVRVQVVLPGNVATVADDSALNSLQSLPGPIVMSGEDLVDAALAGLGLGEAITIPSLPDMDDWYALEAARLALQPNLLRARPAARYLCGHPRLA